MAVNSLSIASGIPWYTKKYLIKNFRTNRKIAKLFNNWQQKCT